MSYHRRTLGDDDGPITHPDDPRIVGEVTPTRVACEDLPADSPWRQPGQVCAPSLAKTISDGLAKLGYFISGAPSDTPGTSPTSKVTTTPDTGTSPLLWLALAAGGYYLLRKKKS